MDLMEALPPTRRGSLPPSNEDPPLNQSPEARADQDSSASAPKPEEIPTAPDMVESGAMSLSIGRLLETEEVTLDHTGGLDGPFKRIAQMDYHHVPTGVFSGEERDDQFEVYYAPREEALVYGPATKKRKACIGVLRTRCVCQAWGRCLSMSWDRPEITGDPSADRAIVRKWRQKGDCRSMRIAAHMLMPKLRKVLALAGRTALRIQRKAFSTLGSVPSWAFTPERLRERAEEYGWDNPEYAVEDFLRMRWFRLALNSKRGGEHKRLRTERADSGRARKALAQVPRGISGLTMQQAIGLLDVTPEPPSRRLTWIALSFATEKTSAAAELATAIQRASTYKLRKAFRRGREIRAEQNEELSEEDFYVHSETGALRMISWLADVNMAENEALHCTGRTDLVNWAERSGRYHRNLARRRRERESKEVLKTNPFQTGVRPVSLPDGMEALTRPHEVLEEGKRMNHCVDSFASEVAKGSSMIFHYETGGHHATIQLKKTKEDAWFVRQARGPDNAYNRATSEGKQKVQEWLEQDPEVKAPRFELGEASCPADTTRKRRKLSASVKRGKRSPKGSEEQGNSEPSGDAKTGSGGACKPNAEKWTDRPNLEDTGEEIEAAPQEEDGLNIPF